eukprot:gene14214-16761_t
MGSEMRKQRKEDLETYTKGLKAKAEMIKDAARILEEKTNEMASLKKEIDPLNEDIKQLEVQKNLLEAKRDEEQKRLEEERRIKEEEEAKNAPPPPPPAAETEVKEGETTTEGETKTEEEAKKEDEPFVPVTSEQLESHKQELGDVETRLSAKKSDLRSKQESIDNIQSLLDHEHGPAHVYLPLYGKCFDIPTKEYTYTMCPFGKATQGGTSLGFFEKWENNNSAMIFGGGQQCWGGPKRSLKVILECGSDNVGSDVQEPSKCEYSMKFKTPAACDEGHLKILQLEDDHEM